MSCLSETLRCPHAKDATITVVTDTGGYKDRYGLIHCPDCGGYRKVVDYLTGSWALPACAMRSKHRLDCLKLERRDGKKAGKLKSGLHGLSMKCEHPRKAVIGHWNRETGRADRRMRLEVCTECGSRRSTHCGEVRDWLRPTWVKEASRRVAEKGIKGGWENPYTADIYTMPLIGQENDDYIDGAAEKMGARILSIR